MRSYKELTVWQKGVELVTRVYRLSAQYPREELYGLTSQTRRAAVSIPANIAEGFARKHRQEYIQFLRIAFGSGAELETHLIIAKKLNLLREHDFSEVDGLLTEVMKMLNVFIDTLVTKH